MDVSHLLEELNFSLDENIPEDLFSRNILIRSNKEDSYNVSFYYSKIRDYIICFHSFKLEKLNDEEFYKVLGSFYHNHIGKSALDFYIENASHSHQDVLRRYKKDKAIKYVSDYENFIDVNFNTFKDKFNPETKGDIGILLPKDLIKKDGYALLPVNLETENRVQFESLEDPFTGSDGKNLFFERGVISVSSSNRSILVSDQTSIIKKNIFKQLKEIMQKGKISAYNSEILLIEKVSLILYYYYKKLDYNFIIEDYNLPRFKSIYPINLKDLKQRINKFKLTEFYKNKRTERSLIKEIVEKDLKENRDIPKFNWKGGVPPFEELSKIVDILLENGRNEINEHYLTLPDKSITETKAFYEKNRKDNWNQIRTFQYSASQANLYIKDFFKKLEICCKEFVEYSFPNLKDELSFYKAIPHEYIFYMKESDILKWGTFGYRPSKTSKLEVYFRDSNKSKEAFEKEELKCLRAFSLDMILRVNDYTRYPVQTVDRINTSDIDEYCVIRNWIYKFLEDDMEKLFKENND